MFKISKRYKDIFDQCIHKGEPTPFSLGTICVFALCLLLMVIATFSQVTLSHYWLVDTPKEGLHWALKTVVYFPQVPVMIFIIYILRQSYSYLLFLTYLIIGFFFYPIFAFGGGIEYMQNYLFGYLLGFGFAIYTTSLFLKKSQSIKARLIAGLIGIATIHVCGLFYCFILAIFRFIDFGLIGQIFKVLSINKIMYDVFFSSIIMLLAPYIKNVLWICMQTKNNPRKRLKNSRKRNQIISDDID